MWLAQNALAKPDHAGAGATDYMHLFGLVALGYMWARMAEAAGAKLASAANGTGERMNAKLVTGRFFVERMLPEASSTMTSWAKRGPEPISGWASASAHSATTSI